MAEMAPGGESTKEDQLMRNWQPARTELLCLKSQYLYIPKKSEFFFMMYFFIFYIFLFLRNQNFSS